MWKERKQVTGDHPKIQSSGKIMIEIDCPAFEGG
jgi:hypothetical protein